MKRIEVRAARWAIAAGVACALAAAAMQRSRSQQESVIGIDALLDCALHGDEHDRCEADPADATDLGERAYAERS